MIRKAGLFKILGLLGMVTLSALFGHKAQAQSFTPQSTMSQLLQTNFGDFVKTHFKDVGEIKLGQSNFADSTVPTGVIFELKQGAGRDRMQMLCKAAGDAIDTYNKEGRAMNDPNLQLARMIYKPLNQALNPNKLMRGAPVCGG